MRKATIVFIAIFFSINTFSQRHAIDSMLQLLPTLKDDSSRTKLYSNLASAYYSIKPDSFFMYCNKGMALAQSLKLKNEYCLLSLKKASMLTDTGNYNLALKYAEQSLSIAKEINSQHLLIESYIVTGRVYDFQSDFVTSSDYFFKALTIAQEINDHSNIATVGTNLSAAFFNQGDFKKSEQYSFLTLKEAKIANAPADVYKALYAIGMAKVSLGDSINARNYYYQAINICRQNSFALDEAEVTTDLATIETSGEKKITLLMKARKIYDSLSPASFNSGINLESLGEAYLGIYKAQPGNKDFLNKAGVYTTLFLNKATNENDQASMAQAFDNLSEINELKGDYRKAYQFIKQYHKINDSVFSQTNKNKIAAFESRDEIDKKNNEIETQTQQIREQKKNVLLLIAGIILITCIGILFYRLSAIRKQKNQELVKLNQELDKANSLKVRFFGILSHDLRSPIANLVNFLNLRKIKPGALSNQQIDERENKISAAAELLLETMESMLLWSKGQMQNFKPENKMVKASALFFYIKKTFAGNDQISFSFLDEEDVLLHTDENYLRTIMYNLTTNAVKALSNIDDAKIEWKAWLKNNKPFLSVTDNGHGIDDEKMKALYDESTASGTRHGFGLHIIRDLAKAIQCNIELRFNIPHGTIAILQLQA